MTRRNSGCRPVESTLKVSACTSTTRALESFLLSSDQVSPLSKTVSLLMVPRVDASKDVHCCRPESSADSFTSSSSSCYRQCLLNPSVHRRPPPRDHALGGTTDRDSAQPARRWASVAWRGVPHSHPRQDQGKSRRSIRPKRPSHVRSSWLSIGPHLGRTSAG